MTYIYATLFFIIMHTCYCDCRNSLCQSVVPLDVASCSHIEVDVALDDLSDVLSAQTTPATSVWIVLQTLHARQAGHVATSLVATPLSWLLQ